MITIIIIYLFTERRQQVSYCTAELSKTVAAVSGERETPTLQGMSLCQHLVEQVQHHQSVPIMERNNVYVLQKILLFYEYLTLFQRLLCRELAFSSLHLMNTAALQ